MFKLQLNKIKSRAALVRAGLALALLLNLTTPSVFATSYYWDADGATSGATGGTGTWDASSSLWRNGSSTGTLSAWPNTNPNNVDTAQLAGTAGTLTLNSSSVNINVNNITFGTTGYTIAAPSSGTATLNLEGATPTFDTGASPNSETVSAIISGSAGLTKAGTGTLILSAANTYSGNTTVSAGILNLGNINAIQNSPSVSIASSGATLWIGAIGTFVTPASISIVGTGSSTYVGPLHFRSGGTLTNALTLGGTTTISSFGNTVTPTLGGAIGGTGPLTILAQGGGATAFNLWTLNAASTYSGNTVILNDNGLLDVTVKLGIVNALPTTTSLNLQTVSSTTTNAFATLDLNGNPQTLAGLTDTGSSQSAASYTAGSRVINSGTLATLTINNSGADTYGTTGTRVLPGTIGGTTAGLVAANNLALVKTGAGTLTLAGTNTYTGSTTVSNGLINLGVAETVGTGGPLGKPTTLANSIVLQGGGLQFSSANTYDYTTSGRLQLADGTNGIIDDGGQTVTFANAIGLGAAKTGALIKQGVGTLTLNPGAGNTNSMGSLAVQAGNVTLSSGTLNVTTPGTATTSSTGPGLIISGGTLTIAGGTNNTSTALSIHHGGTLTLSSGTFSNDGQIFNAYGFMGTINLNGGLLSANQLRVSQYAGNGGLGGVVNLNGGTLQLNFFSSGGSVGTVYFNGATVLAKSSQANFVAEPTYNLVVSTNGAIIDTSTYSIGISNALTHASALGATADGGLTKLGTGTLTLYGTNTYTGVTTIGGGTLTVNGNNSGAGGAVAVNAGGTLGGTNTIGGAVTVANNATAVLYPHGSATLNLSQTLTFSGTSSGVKFDLSSSATGANDKVALANQNVTITGTPQITINSAGTLDYNDYVLIDAGSGTVSGAFNTTPVFTGTTPKYSGQYSIVTSAHQVKLHYTPIALTVTANSGQSKVYGATDPTFTYTLASGSLVTGDNFSGVLSRATGENVGNYAILQNTLTAGNYYSITFNSANFGITQKPITVTATSGQSKVYGASDPTLTYGVSPALITGDSFSGALSRAAGENVGSSYAIALNNLTNANYSIAFTPANFAITQKPITVTATSGQTKVYGAVDPTFTYTVSPALVGSDTLTGSLSRAAGETVAGSPYAIALNNLTNVNYSIAFVSANFAITTRPISITAQPNTKIHDGDTTATNVPTLTAGTLASGDGFATLAEHYLDAAVGTGKTLIPTATITNSATTDVTANYAITPLNDTTGVINSAQATTSLLLTNSIGETNYYGQTLIFTAVVETNNVTAANASSNVVFSLGSTPVWTNVVVGGVAYYTNDDLTVGVTNFTAQYLGDNNYLGSSVTVTQTVLQTTPTLTLTASAITYGQTLTSSSLTGSVATNGYDADADGDEAVTGSFAFADNTIAPNAGVTNVLVIFTPTDSTNYTTATNTVAVTVNKANSTVTVTGTTSFTYDGAGQGPASASFTGSSGALSFNYSGTGFGPSANTPTNAGSYTVTATLAADSNYNSATSSPTAFNISPAPASVTADAKTKPYGTGNPPLTATVVGQVIGGDTINYSLNTDAGQYSAVGVSNIMVTLGGNPNYNVSATNGTLTISQANTFVGASSSENPSGFKDTVSYTATLPADATGSVVFSSTNGAFSTNAVSSGSATSFSITNLPRGTNVITVDYLGDGNYLGSTTNLNQIVTNHPPVANVMAVTRTAGLALIIKLSDIATNWNDVDGDTVELTSVTMQSTNGVNLFPLNWSTNLDGSIVTTNGYAYIGYTNSPNVPDQISYGISDGFGGTNIGYVNIVIQGSVTGTNSITAYNFTSPSSNTVTAYGIPYFSYILERSTNLSSPVWVDVQTNQAAPNGVINMVDLFMDLGGVKPSPAFYQLKWQP